MGPTPPSLKLPPRPPSRGYVRTPRNMQAYVPDHATELLARNGRYRQLYDKQYRFERDRFINPGEDFTPEPEVVALPSAARPNNAL